MKKYIGKRIMISLVTLLIIILVLFMLLQLMPGSPFNDEKLTALARQAATASASAGSTAAVESQMWSTVR